MGSSLVEKEQYLVFFLFFNTSSNSKLISLIILYTRPSDGSITCFASCVNRVFVKYFAISKSSYESFGQLLFYFFIFYFIFYCIKINFIIFIIGVYSIIFLIRVRSMVRTVSHIGVPIYGGS